MPPSCKESVLLKAHTGTSELPVWMEFGGRGGGEIQVLIYFTGE